MKASERARRYRQQDETERRSPWGLLYETRSWTLYLAAMAIGCAVTALTNDIPEAWWFAGGCAVGSALCWMFERSI